MTRRRIFTTALAAALLTFLGAVPAPAARAAAAPPDTIPGHRGTYYFYRGLDYGSQSLIHPARLIINGGYGIMQVENRDNDPFKIKYARGAQNVVKNLLNPHWSLRVNGFWDFFKREVFPVSVNTGQSQYWPNYMNHLLGGGMSYRMMDEYYRYHGVQHSREWAGVTIFCYHFLNEVVENDGLEGPNPDPVADFWIFNPAGVLLFANDDVAAWFAHTLHMADWSYQTLYLPDSHELANNGQNYAVKLHLNDAGSRSLFYHWGSHAELGMSFTREDGRCFSFGLGLKAKNLLEVDEISKTVDMAVSGGVFYDRNNSLLASLLFARTKDYRYRLNLYPGLFDLGKWRPGFVAALDEHHDLTLGVTFGTLSHLPFGLGGTIETD